MKSCFSLRAVLPDASDDWELIQHPGGKESTLSTPSLLKPSTKKKSIRTLLGGIFRPQRVAANRPLPAASPVGASAPPTLPALPRPDCGVTADRIFYPTLPEPGPIPGPIPSLLSPKTSPHLPAPTPTPTPTTPPPVNAKAAADITRYGEDNCDNAQFIGEPDWFVMDPILDLDFGPDHGPYALQPSAPTLNATTSYTSDSPLSLASLTSITSISSLCSSASTASTAITLYSVFSSKTTLLLTHVPPPKSKPITIDGSTSPTDARGLSPTKATLPQTPGLGPRQAVLQRLPRSPGSSQLSTLSTPLDDPFGAARHDGCWRAAQPLVASVAVFTSQRSPLDWLIHGHFSDAPHKPFKSLVGTSSWSSSSSSP